MNTLQIYCWLHDWIVAKEDNRPVLQDVHIDAGYAYASDGYSMARIPLHLIDATEWMQVHQREHGNYGIQSIIAYRYPCGAETIMPKDHKYGKYPDPRNVYLRAWDVLETVDMTCLVWDIQVAKAHGRDGIQYGDLRLGVPQLDKLIHCPAFLSGNVEAAITVTQRRSKRIMRFTATNGIELYIMPMSK